VPLQDRVAKIREMGEKKEPSRIRLDVISNIRFPPFCAGRSPLCSTLLLHPALLCCIKARPAYVLSWSDLPLDAKASSRETSSLP
jgi:hypothetical protein